MNTVETKDLDPKSGAEHVSTQYAGEHILRHGVLPAFGRRLV